MLVFQVCQYIKDCTSVFVFFIFANMPLLMNDIEMLCLLFSFCCLIDSIFISIRRYNEYPITISTVKDSFGVIVMFCFTMILAYKLDVINWQKIFYSIFIIDYMSICSLLFGFNIYKVRAHQFLPIFE
jgi:hypothetical protein